jgi:tyrosine decarboxylase / aspartate 1-decarboxylase
VFAAAERLGLYLAIAELPVAFFADALRDMSVDAETIVCLRSVLMKPEHLEWLDEIIRLLARAVDAR